MYICHSKLKALTRFLFIVNPKSGTTTKNRIVEKIRSSFNENEYTIQYTNGPRHATELASEFARKNGDTVVATGGDGTINEIAQAICDSDTKMAIIPCGSGNGLAGHLGISKEVDKAIQIIKSGHTKPMDLIRINGRICCNTTGLGFNAYVAKRFAESHARGFKTYLQIGLLDFGRYQPFACSMEHLRFNDLLTLEIANSSQLGNRAIISKYSLVSDGKAEIITLQKPNIIDVPRILTRVFAGKLHLDKNSELVSFEKATLRTDRNVELHIDGEFIMESDLFEVEVLPRQLSVYIPEKDSLH